MKKHLLLAAALAGATLTANAFAFNPKSATTSADQPAPRVIAATAVGPRDLPRTFVDSIVSVEFALDPAGQPHDIKVLAVSDTRVQRQVVAAFRQWRFEIGSADAVTTPRRFVLPIQIRAEG